MGPSSSSISSLKSAVKREIDESNSSSKLNLISILHKYSSIENYVHSLKIKIITSPLHPNLKDFYSLYNEFFVILEEREEFTGFKKTLSLNKSSVLKKRYGNFEEVIICFFDPSSNKLIASVNFANYSYSKKLRKKFGYLGSTQLIYLFVHSSFRKFGIAKYILSLVEENYSKNFFLGIKGVKALNKKPSKKVKVLFFCEQNNPKQMSLHSQLIDSLGAKISQEDRGRWWSKRGYNVLKLNYFQPSLSKDSKSFNELVLLLKSNYSKKVPSELVWAHLDAYFSISVLKGINGNEDLAFIKQKKALKSKPFVQILN